MESWLERGKLASCFSLDTLAGYQAILASNSALGAIYLLVEEKISLRAARAILLRAFIIPIPGPNPNPVRGSRISCINPVVVRVSPTPREIYITHMIRIIVIQGN